ncbi:MAG TPA: hypothetical protein VM577_16040, partial [Anaerovoracaceae bacterium]|nr:hypothetical protein [Anaerovoracaceae bacterium]
KDYFNNTLYYIYYEGSDINSSIKKINTYREKASEFEKKKAQGGFLTTEEYQHEQEELKTKEEEAEKAKKNLEKKKEGGRSILTPQIIERRTVEFSAIELGSNPEVTSVKSVQESKGNYDEPVDPNNYKPKNGFLVDTMFPCASKKERKLLSETLDKIFVIIQKSTDKKTSENIIKRIKEELR